MYKIDRRGGLGGIQKSYTRTDPKNVLEDFYQQNKCFNSYTAMFAKESKNPKAIFKEKKKITEKWARYNQT